MSGTECAILGLLSERPMTGYEIKQAVDVRFRFFWSESYGQLYPALKALCSRDLIGETGAAEEPGVRAKKTYALRPAGLEALRDWLGRPVGKESVRLELLLKLYFSHLVGPEVMLGHVRAFRVAHEQDLRMLEAFTAELRAIEADDPAHPAILRVIDFGLRANRAYLDWCAETEHFLKGRREQ